MIKEALEYLIGLADDPILIAAGGKYSRYTLNRLRPPIISPIKVNTLGGLVDVLRRGPEGMPAPAMIHVMSPTQVQVIGRSDAPEYQRPVFVACEPAELPRHAFGSYLGQETFIVWLLSCFEAVGDRVDVLTLAGNITHEAVSTIADDGVSQRATARSGIARVADVVVKSPCLLAPMCTFPEVAQPESRFIFRLRGGGEKSPPELALFEVADGAWRLEAMKRIAAHLTALIADMGQDAPPVVY